MALGLGHRAGQRPVAEAEPEPGSVAECPNDMVMRKLSGHYRPGLGRTCSSLGPVQVAETGSGVPFVDGSVAGFGVAADWPRETDSGTGTVLLCLAVLGRLGDPVNRT